MGCWREKQALAGGKDSVGALWAAVVRTARPRLLEPRLCVRWIWNVLKTVFCYVLQARLLTLQFSKTAFCLKRGAIEWKKGNRFPFFHGFYIYHCITKCSVCFWEEDKLWRGNESVGAMWATGGKTSPDKAAGTKALCGLCGLLEASEMSLQRFVGRVLQARLLNLQFCENCICFETRCSWVKRITDFRFSRFLYIPLNNKVLCVLLRGEQALMRQRLCGGSVGCWMFCVGGIWNVLETIFWLCIAGACAKFAIFENRIFWNDVQLSEQKITDFCVFCIVFIYTIE